MNKKNKYNEIKVLVENDRLSEAIEKLKTSIGDNELLNDLILQSAKYTEIKRMIRNDIISFEQANSSKAKIRLSILQLLDELEKGNKNKKFKNNVKITNYFTIFIFFLVISFFLFKYHYNSQQGNVVVSLQPMENKSKNEPKDSNSTLISNQEKKTKNGDEINTKKTIKQKTVDETANELMLPVIEGQVLNNTVGNTSRTDSMLIDISPTADSPNVVTKLPHKVEKQSNQKIKVLIVAPPDSEIWMDNILIGTTQIDTFLPKGKLFNLKIQIDSSKWETKVKLNNIYFKRVKTSDLKPFN
ncbi:MAG: hypothetical protein EPGJADBJ_00342 [Saprospiraceae bacterium]|nr:hypothetical protein [Saprospiraceae bacterium]